MCYNLHVRKSITKMCSPQKILIFLNLKLLDLNKSLCLQHFPKMYIYKFAILNFSELVTYRTF